MIKYGSKKFIFSKQYVSLKLDKIFDKQERRGFTFFATHTNKNVRRVARLCQRKFIEGKTNTRSSLRLWGDMYDVIGGSQAQEVMAGVRNNLGRVIWNAK